MKLPAIAGQTFSRCKEHPVLGQVWRKMLGFLGQIKSPIGRARFVHEAVDKTLNEVFANPVVKNYVSCKKGCSACCYTQVSVTADEAELLASLAKTKIKINFDRLEKQAKVENDAQAWYKLAYNDRKCLFLGDDQTCQIYEDRPSVCRSNNVLSPAILCDTREGLERPIRLLKTEQADMLIAASFIHSKEGGSLPFMLWKALLNMRKQKKDLDL